MNEKEKQAFIEFMEGELKSIIIKEEHGNMESMQHFIVIGDNEITYLIIKDDVLTLRDNLQGYHVEQKVNGRFKDVGSFYL